MKIKSISGKNIKTELKGNILKFISNDMIVELELGELENNFKPSPSLFTGTPHSNIKKAAWVDDGTYDDISKILTMTTNTHKYPNCKNIIHNIKNWNDLGASGNCGVCNTKIHFRFNGCLSKCT